GALRAAEHGPEPGEEPAARLLDRVHADVAVRAAMGAGTASDAVVVDDRDLPARQPHDAVDAAEQAHRILAVPAGSGKQQIVELQTAQLEPAEPVPPPAGVHAGETVGAAILVDHQH